jgi:hypothetical protein
MTMRRLSITVPADVEKTIRAAARRAKKPVSAWIVDAAREKAEREAEILEGQRAARELIAEYEAEHGPIPAEIHEQTRRALIEAGVIPDDLRAAS